MKVYLLTQAEIDALADNLTTQEWGSLGGKKGSRGRPKATLVEMQMACRIEKNVKAKIMLWLESVTGDTRNE